MDPREKEFEKALRKLTPVFQRKLAAKDVRHDLYGKEQLTWNEYERIGRSSGGERGVVPRPIIYMYMYLDLFHSLHIRMFICMW